MRAVMTDGSELLTDNGIERAARECIIDELAHKRNLRLDYETQLRKAAFGGYTGQSRSPAGLPHQKLALDPSQQTFSHRPAVSSDRFTDRLIGESSGRMAITYIYLIKLY